VNLPINLFTHSELASITLRILFNPPPNYQPKKSQKLVASQLRALRSKPNYRKYNIKRSRSGEKLGVGLQEWRECLLSGTLTVIAKTVEKGSPASFCGLRVGDRIVAVNETLVESREHAIDLLSRLGAAKVEVLSTPFHVLDDDDVTSVIETCSESDHDMSDSSGHPESPVVIAVQASAIQGVDLDLDLVFGTDVAIAHPLPDPSPPQIHPLDLLRGR
jgi:membrane-associated protease RseP (regulator of RpoE activity)